MSRIESDRATHRRTIRRRRSVAVAALFVLLIAVVLGFDAVRRSMPDRGGGGRESWGAELCWLGLGCTLGNAYRARDMFSAAGRARLRGRTTRWRGSAIDAYGSTGIAVACLATALTADRASRALILVAVGLALLSSEVVPRRIAAGGRGVAA